MPDLDPDPSGPYMPDWCCIPLTCLASEACYSKSAPPLGPPCMRSMQGPKGPQHVWSIEAEPTSTLKTINEPSSRIPSYRWAHSLLRKLFQGGLGPHNIWSIEAGTKMQPSLKELNLYFNIMNVKLCLLNQEMCWKWRNTKLLKIHESEYH